MICKKELDMFAKFPFSALKACEYRTMLNHHWISVNDAGLQNLRIRQGSTLSVLAATSVDGDNEYICIVEEQDLSCTRGTSCRCRVIPAVPGTHGHSGFSPIVGLAVGHGRVLFEVVLADLENVAIKQQRGLSKVTFCQPEGQTTTLFLRRSL
jgi:hypothetical protein